MADHEGPIVQPLSLVTQTLSAYQQLNAKLVGSATAIGYPYRILEELVGPVATGQEVFNISITNLEIGTASATDTITQSIGATIEDVVTALDAFEIAETTVFAQVAEAADAITQSIALPVTSVVTAADTITSDIVAALSYTVAASSEFVSLAVQGNQLVTGTVAASDEVIPGQTVLLTDAPTATSEITPTFSAELTLSYAVTAADELTNWRITTEELSSSASGSITMYWDGSVYSDIVIGTATITDNLWAKDFSSIAWVLNTESGGITNYSNFGFTSMAFHNGVLYATSAEGLFELGADNDAGRSIDASSKTGFLDFGTESKKRISDMYIGYTGTDLECDIETFDKQVYTYGLEPRENAVPHNNRLKVGRGLSSRYWRFGFRNVSGADFQIQDVAVELAVSKRRL